MENEKLLDLEELDMPEDELFSFIDNSTLDSEKITAPRYSYWHSVFRVFFRKKINIVILAVLAVILLFTYVYPTVTDYDKYANLLDASAKHLTPSAAINKFGFSLRWILGAGASGESTFDAIWYGSRISITLALICAAINMTVGVLVGAVWGFSKKVDIVMQEVYNIIGNVPYILLISVVVMIMSASFWSMVFAMTVTGWLYIAYFMRTQVIIIRDREYNSCLPLPRNINLAYRDEEYPPLHDVRYSYLYRYGNSFLYILGSIPFIYRNGSVGYVSR